MWLSKEFLSPAVYQGNMVCSKVGPTLSGCVPSDFVKSPQGRQRVGP